MTATLFSYFNLNKEPPLDQTGEKLEKLLTKPTKAAKTLAAKLLSENVRAILNVQTVGYRNTGISHSGNTIQIGWEWLNGVTEFSNEYSKFVETYSKNPAKMAEELKAKTPDELTAMKLESDKYVRKINKDELNALIQEEAAKIVNEKLSPHNADGIKWLATFATYFVSSHLFFNHISLPLTALAYLYTSTFYERTLEFESDNLIKKLPMSKELRQYLNRQLLHTLLVKYAPQNAYEKVQSYLTSSDGKNIFDYTYLSFHQPLSNRLQRLS